MAAPVVLQMTPDYAYVILVFVLSIFQLMWMAINVSNARKKYDVPYPNMYSDKSQMFNCIQRVHQNTLEAYPMFLGTLFLGGLKHPCVTAVGGLIVIIGRTIYALGYYTGDPSKRLRGGFFHIGFFMTLGCTISGALSMLGLF